MGGGVTTWGVVGCEGKGKYAKSRHAWMVGYQEELVQRNAVGPGGAQVLMEGLEVVVSVE